MNKDKCIKKQNILYLNIFVVSILCYFYALSFTTLELWKQVLIILAATLIILVVEFSILYAFKKHIKHKKFN
ncbi:hypothetical protein [Clostridium sp. AWRP]|uniref:hypothetical protein n=1 Tax=Clostridium sp. AWRP TaxID=2212991 RepID=UPI000FD8BE19|nr:hypothetical protein [Clostridium sp. AWRP]AZV57651.1 hypothetical protein DMR38_14055 [Clostridium sp. AWRP]